MTRSHTTFALNVESSRDWNAEAWSIPVHMVVSQMLKVGRQPVSVFAGTRYWAANPDEGAEGFGVRSGLTLVFVPARKGGAGGGS